MPILILLVAFFGLCATMHAQSIKYLTDCSRGASFVSNATIRNDGTLLLVGDLGRVGTYTKSASSIAWECLPTQSFLYDVWSRSDTTIVVGEHGEVWYRVASGRWTSIAVPGNDTLRTVTMHNGHLFVAAESGSVWMKSQLSSGEWVASYHAHAGIIDLVSEDNLLLAVGRQGGLYEMEDEWVDLSLANSTLEFACLAVIGNVYVIGADSGLIIRYERDNATWNAVQMLQPSFHEPLDDFRGRDDRTLCIAEGKNSMLLATGNYYAIGGVRYSIDTGRTWQYRPFSEDPLNPDLVYPRFCPVVGNDGDSIISITCSPEVPSTIYITDSTLFSWRMALQSDAFYRPLDTIIFFVRGRCSTVVDGAVVLKPGSEYLTLQNDLPTAPQFIAAVRRLSHFVKVLITADTIVHDTVSVLNGNYTTLYRHGTMIYAGGDSASIASSADNGKNWTIAKIDGFATDMFAIGKFFEDHGRLCALLIGPIPTTSGWSSSSIVELVDGVWHLTKVIPPATYRVMPVEIAVDANGNAALAALEVDGAGEIFAAIYRYDSNSLAYTQTAHVPVNQAVNPDVFFIGDTTAITIAHAIGSASDWSLRCLFVNGELRCDTMMITTAQYEGKLQGAKFTHTDAGYALVGHHEYHGAIVSFDKGLHWRNLPAQMTIFGSEIRFATVDGRNVFVGGLSNFMALLSFDSTQTSVTSDIPTLPAMQCLYDYEKADNEPLPCTVYDLTGRQIAEVIYTGPASLLKLQHLARGRTYALVPIANSRACPTLFMR